MENVLVNEQNLKDIAEAIRNKNKTDETYTPGEMAAAIGELKTEFVTEDKVITENGIYTPGDGVDGFREVAVDVNFVTDTLEVTQNGYFTPPDGVDGFVRVDVNVPGEIIPPQAFEISGDCKYKFTGDGWNWYLDMMGDRLTTKDIGDVSYMFQNNPIERIPFVLNFDSSKQYHVMTSMFHSCNNLTHIPGIVGAKPSAMENMFSYCWNLRYLPENFVENIDWTYFSSLTSAYAGNTSGMFYYCYSLREIPSELFDKFPKYTVQGYSTYNSNFKCCYVLEELTNLPCYENHTGWTSNCFSSTFGSCHRLKRVTFSTNPDGTPKQTKWKNQTIDLSNQTGFNSGSGVKAICGYNSGITEEKRVRTPEDYERLKNDPDWWTDLPDYSRYNHDSAVETINSLPDTSAYGTNTIKFIAKGTAIPGYCTGVVGCATDGGAIEDLTAEEIAVATAKGWTVTLV